MSAENPEILLIDEHPLHHLTQTLLGSKYHLPVTAVESFEETLEPEFQDANFQLIIIGLRPLTLHGPIGIEVAHQVREKYPDKTIIFYSSDPTHATKTETLNTINNSHYLVKLDDPVILVNLIDQLLQTSTK